MSRQNLFSQNTVQTIIDSLDPRKKFLDLAKKNSTDTTPNPFTETPVKGSAVATAKRIEEKINETFVPSQTDVNKPVDKSDDKPVDKSVTTCIAVPVERSRISVCVVVEIILLLLTLIACFYYMKKQVELTKDTNKQTKKIIKLLKTHMALMIKP